MKKQFIKDLPIYLNGFAIGWIFWRLPKYEIMDILMYVLSAITFFWYGKTQIKKEKPLTPKKYVIFNINTFNEWFNDKDNNAVYAHSGIFLRLDKLSESHIKDYIIKCHGLTLSDCDLDEDIRNFHEEIRKDWLNKLNQNETK
jgi:hypothetical protein